MADKQQKDPERISPFEKPGEGARKKPLETKELKEQAKEFIEGVSEVVEGAEVSEAPEGEISEIAKESKRKAPSGKGVSKSHAGAAKVVLPELDVMVIQIKTRVKKEILELEKERKQLMRSPSNFSPFKLNQIVSKIRYLKDVLAELAYATADGVKQLWYKYVRGSKY